MKGEVCLTIIVILVVSMSFAYAQIPQDDSQCFHETVFTRGDATGNGIISITDAVTILNYLFLGEVEPLCLKNSDADGNNVVSINDAILILGFLFQGGQSPVNSQLSDFVLYPKLFPLSPQENPELNVMFSPEKEMEILSFYPFIPYGSAVCDVVAISEETDEEVLLFEVGLNGDLLDNQISDFFPIRHAVVFGDPLGVGAYDIVSTCSRDDEILSEERGRLVIRYGSSRGEDENPVDTIQCYFIDEDGDGEPDEVDEDGDGDPDQKLQETCCDNPRTSENPDYCYSDLDGLGVGSSAPSCNFGDVQLDASVCCPTCGMTGNPNGEQELATTGPLLEDEEFIPLQIITEPYDDTQTENNPNKCRVKCVTILRDSLTADCRGDTITFPKEKFEAEGEFFGFQYVSDGEESSWESGVPGIGPNKGFVTRKKGDNENEDSRLAKSLEQTEKVGYGFIVAATYVGVDEDGNEIDDVNPRECREFQFYKMNEETSYYPREIGKPAIDKKVKPKFFSALPVNDVLEEDAYSLLELDESKELLSDEGIIELKNMHDLATAVPGLFAGLGAELRRRLDPEETCELFGSRVCQDGYYKKKGEAGEGDYRRDREHKGGLIIYDPNERRDRKHFLKRFDLNPEDGVKKMFYYDNPGMDLTKSMRRLFNSGDFVNYKNVFDFYIIVEDEGDDSDVVDHRIICRLNQISTKMEPGTVEESRKTVRTSGIRCECKEYIGVIDPFDPDVFDVPDFRWVEGTPSGNGESSWEC